MSIDRLTLQNIKTFRQSNPTLSGLSDEQILSIMTANPKMIKTDKNLDIIWDCNLRGGATTGLEIELSDDTYLNKQPLNKNENNKYKVNTPAELRTIKSSVNGFQVSENYLDGELISRTISGTDEENYKRFFE